MTSSRMQVTVGTPSAIEGACEGMGVVRVGKGPTEAGAIPGEVWEGLGGMAGEVGGEWRC